MYTKAELLGKLNLLKARSPSAAAELFTPVTEAIEAYFAADVDLERDVKYTMHQLITDIVNRTTVYEHQDLLPPFTPEENAPVGYSNVMDLFDGGGAFDSLMTVTIEDFLQAFEGLSGAVTTAEPAAISNVYLTEWEGKIGEARSQERAGLAAVCTFCDSGGYNTGLVMFFADLGDTVSSASHAEIAERLYISGGYLELINAFGFNVYIPETLQKAGGTE